MNELAKVMTVSQVADVLGVTPEAIKKHVRELWPGEMVNGKAYLLTEEQAVEIKRHMRPTTKLAGAVTELEENQTIANALMILQRRNEEYKRRAEEAERRNAILMHTQKLYTVTEIAKELGMTSAEKLNKVLEEAGIQYKVNGTWVPKAKYADLGYFEIKQEVHDNGFVYYDRKVTQDGRLFILNLLSA